MVLLIIFIGFLVLEFLILSVDWIFTCTPYACMLLITLVLWTAVDGIHNLIPGHGGLSFLSAAFVAVVITAVLTHINSISAPFISLCCAFVMTLVFEIILGSYMKPDSVQYCILLTVAYSILLAVNILLNVHKSRDDMDDPFVLRNLFTSVIAGLMNGVTVLFYMYMVKNIWNIYWYEVERRDAIRMDELAGNVLEKTLGSMKFASVAGARLFLAGEVIAFLGAIAVTVVVDRIRKKMWTDSFAESVVIEPVSAGINAKAE